MLALPHRIKEAERLTAARKQKAGLAKAGEAAQSKVSKRFDALDAAAQVSGDGTLLLTTTICMPCMSAVPVHPRHHRSAVRHTLVRLHLLNTTLCWVPNSAVHSCGGQASHIDCMLGGAHLACHDAWHVRVQRFNGAAERLGLLAAGGGAGKRARGVAYEARVDASATAAADIMSADLKVSPVQSTPVMRCADCCGSRARQQAESLRVSASAWLSSVSSRQHQEKFGVPVRRVKVVSSRHEIPASHVQQPQQCHRVQCERGWRQRCGMRIGRQNRSPAL